MKLLIIVNPQSGTKKGVQQLDKLLPYFNSNNIKTEVIHTKYHKHATDITASYNFSDINAVIGVGGDGTFHEVVTGLMKRKDSQQLPIGIIPGGSGNSFLYETNDINPISIFKKILLFKKRRVDILEIKTVDTILYSINLVGWGLVTDIGEKAEKYRWLGPSRYTLVSLIEIIKNKNRSATLTIENEKNTNQFTFIIACNTKYVGKGMYMAPKASTNDGLLDLIVVKGNLSRWRLFKTLPKLFKGTHLRDPNITYHQISNFSIETKEKDLLNIDGELKGTTPISVKVIPNAIEILN